MRIGFSEATRAFYDNGIRCPARPSYLGVGPKATSSGPFYPDEQDDLTLS